MLDGGGNLIAIGNSARQDALPVRHNGHAWWRPDIASSTPGPATWCSGSGLQGAISFSKRPANSIKFDLIHPSTTSPMPTRIQANRQSLELDSPRRTNTQPSPSQANTLQRLDQIFPPNKAMTRRGYSTGSFITRPSPS